MSRSSGASAVVTKRDRPSGQSGAAGPAHAMHVVLGDERQIVVDYQRQLHDIKTASGDIGGHQHGDAAGLEIAERPAAGALPFVSVNHRHRETFRFEMIADAIRATLGLAEDQRLAGGRLRQHVQQQGALAIGSDRDARDA